jgi:hypothetical protein
MKRSLIIAGLFLFTFAINSIAQERLSTKSELKKEIEMQENNGEKTLTIRTSSNGTESVEVYKGEAAVAKMAELQKENNMNTDVREEILVVEKEGQKTVTVTRTENGVRSSQVLTGEAAEQKLREAQNAGNQTPEPAPEKVKRKEIERIEIKRNR